MQDFALPKYLPWAAAVGAEAWARRKSGSVRPSAVRPPATSVSRRVGPLHSRLGEPRTRSTVGSPETFVRQAGGGTGGTRAIGGRLHHHAVNRHVVQAKC